MVSKSPRMKREGKNLGGKEYLKKKLKSRGFSRRKSVAVVDLILERMIHGLRRGEEVEFPFGKLVRVRKSFGPWWDAADDWPAHRQPYRVEWELSPAGRERLIGPLGEEERAYLKAIWQAPEPEQREVRGRKKRAVPSGK